MFDPYELLRVLEDVSEEHARVIKSLSRYLERLRKYPSDDGLQLHALSCIKRLRNLRSKLMRSLPDSSTAFRLVESMDSELRNNILTLSEYMVLVGLLLEEEAVNKALRLASKGARLLESQREYLEQDLYELRKLNERLQSLLETLSRQTPTS